MKHKTLLILYWHIFLLGVIFNETKKSFTEDEDRELTATQSFDSFHYWNLDKEPSHGDRLHQALTWIDIAKAVSISKYSSEF